MNPNLLILGGGRSLWDDYFRAKELLGTYEIMCVNDIAGQFTLEPIHHVVSLHCRLLPALKILRLEKSMTENYTAHSITAGEGVGKVWSKAFKSSDSGTSAVLMALHLGYRKIIMCGVPLDDTGHYWDPPIKLDHAKPQWSLFAKRGREKALKQMAERNSLVKTCVRSLSGQTAETFGKPDQEWANGNNK